METTRNELHFYPGISVIFLFLLILPPVAGVVWISLLRWKGGAGAASLVNVADWLAQVKKPEMKTAKTEKTSSMKKKVFAIINPVSGQGAGQTTEVFLREVCDALEYSLTVVRTEGRGHAAAIGASYQPAANDLCICAGGDGLLSEFMNGFLAISKTGGRFPQPLLVCPIGTGNGVAMNLGLKDIQASMNAMTSSNESVVDLMLVESCSNSSSSSSDVGFRMYSFLSVSWGLIADIDYASETSMRWIGTSRIFWLSVYMLLRHRTYDGRVEFIVAPNTTKDVSRYATVQRGKETWHYVDDSFSMVSVCNMPWIADDVCLAPDAKAKSGTMSLLLVRKCSRWMLLRMLLETEKGTHVRFPELEVVECSRVNICPKDEASTLMVADGERVPPGAIRISCIENAVPLKVI